MKTNTNTDGAKYRYFFTMFITLRDALRGYLKQNNIYYELSGQRAEYHFSILATDEQAEQINSFLDIVTITHTAI